MTAIASAAGAELIGRACALALTLHARQVRKHDPDEPTPIPYGAHLLGVASILMEHPAASAEHVAAGLLHDAVEDQPSTLGISADTWRGGGTAVTAALSEQLLTELGPAGSRVADLVMHATEDRSVELPSGATEDEKRADWRRRKELYIEHLAHATLDEALVSVADNIYNLRSILIDLEAKGDAVWALFNAPKADKIWQYEQLRDALVASFPNDRLVCQFSKDVARLRTEVGTPTASEE